MHFAKIAAVATLLAALLTAPTSAQSCSTLAVNGTGAPETVLTFAVTGATANSPTLLLVGETTGSTVIPLGPFGTLTLGLAVPFIPLPLGVTDAQGAATLRFNVPRGTPSADLFGQALTIGFGMNGGRPTLSFCTSNVPGFHIGS
jgi:hypothetical protein